MRTLDALKVVLSNPSIYLAASPLLLRVPLLQLPHAVLRMAPEMGLIMPRAQSSSSSDLDANEGTHRWWCWRNDLGGEN